MAGWKSKLRKRTHNKGSAMILVMVFALVFAIVIGAVLTDVQQETRMTHRARLMTNTLEAAKSSARSMRNNIIDIAEGTPAQLGGSFANLDAVIKAIEPVKPAGSRFITHNGHKMTYVRDIGPNDLSFREIIDSSDELYGYTTMRLDYELVSFLQEDIGTNDLLGFDGMGVKTRVKIDYVPLYQFAIFYEPRLELHPGPAMDIRGRVHSNGDMYLSSGGGLKMYDRVSATGNIYRYVTTSGGYQGGDVQIKDKSGTFRSVSPDGNPSDSNDYLEHPDANWYEEALERWDGNVMDSAHGIRTIRPPLPAGSEMRDMISRVTMTEETEEQRAIKFERQSDVVIVGDPGNPSTLRIYVQTFNDDGSFKERLGPYPNPVVSGKPLITYGEFYDGHQLTIVRTLDVNVDVLRQQTLFDFTDGRGSIYVSTTPTNTTGWSDGFTLAAQNRDPQYRYDSNDRIYWDSKGFPADSSGTRLPNSQLGWIVGGSTPEEGDPAYMPAVRIINGARVPRNSDNAFAFYSDRPWYIVGNLNSTDKATLVVGGDAVTITEHKMELARTKSDSKQKWFNRDANGNKIDGTNSDGTKRGFSTYMGTDWSSSFYDWNGERKESAGTLTTNAILLMGNCPSIYTNGIPVEQSGGAHNVMRYLESWGTHNFNGSMIVLFHSSVAARWFRDDKYAGNKVFRNPPTRKYFWDSSLQTAVPPPGFPVVIEVKTYPMEPVGMEYAEDNAPS